MLAREGCQVRHEEQVIKKLNGAGLGFIPEPGLFWVILKGAPVVMVRMAVAAIHGLHRRLGYFRRELVRCLLVLLRLGRVLQGVLNEWYNLGMDESKLGLVQVRRERGA